MPRMCLLPLTCLAMSLQFEDSKPAARCAPIMLDSNMDRNFNRVAFTLPHPLFSKNPVPKNTEECDTMTAEIASDKKEEIASAERRWARQRAEFHASLEMRRLMKQ
jgi:hypothetical protein